MPENNCLVHGGCIRDLARGSSLKSPSREQRRGYFKNLLLAPPFLARKLPLLVAGLDAPLLGCEPYLQQVHWLAARSILLAVGDAGARAHALHLARPNHRTRAHAVFVLERALEHVGNDLHIVMRMSPKAAPALHPVFIDHAQAAEAHVRRIVVIRERECMECIQPAVIGVATLICLPDLDHLRTSTHSVRRDFDDWESET